MLQRYFLHDRFGNLIYITCYDWQFWNFVFDLVENLSITRYPYGTPEVVWAANIKIKTSVIYVVHTEYNPLLLFLLYFSGVSLPILKGGMNICSAIGQGPYSMRKDPLEKFSNRRNIAQIEVQWFENTLNTLPQIITLYSYHTFPRTKTAHW